MDMEILPPTSRRFIPSDGLMDTLSEDVIGIILAYVDSARSLVTASATCRKWHEAAMHHLHKLTFIESDFNKQMGPPPTVPGMREIIITKLVMKMSCLLQLSITADSSFAFQAAPVIAWLMHTRKTLKYLVFMNHTKPSVNILEYLGVNLEGLKWKFARIPTVDPATLCFRSMSSLELWTPDELTVGNLKALLLVCPKLERLKLMEAGILPYVARSQKTLELVSSSLKCLDIDRGLNGIDSLVLLIDCLETLSLTGLRLNLLKLVHGKGSNALQNLYIDNAEITQVDFGGAANSLLELTICGTKDITAEWGKYYEVISGANKLRKLEICGLSKAMSGSIDLLKIASSFPSLRWLALDYENAFEAFASCGSTESPFLEKVADLELACNRAHEGCAQWIAQFLGRCSSLRRLTIIVDNIDDDKKALGRFTSLVLQSLRQYPHVDAKFEFTE